MTEHNRPRATDDPGDLERLVTRIVDDEAGAADRSRFEQLAGSDPGLWRTLALRLEDMQRLRTAYEVTVATAVETDLAAGDDEDRLVARPVARPVARTGWTLAAAGWAAVLVLGVLWATVTVGPPDPSGDLVQAPAQAPRLSPDEHLERYKLGAFFKGELQPTVLQVEELDDGRLRVRYLRRFEEEATYDPAEVQAVDVEGYLVAPPSQLRDRREVETDSASAPG